MIDLLDQLDACLAEKKQAILATIIHKEGSTYRGVGAKSLFFSSGQCKGILSGGCVEQDIAEHARQVLETGKSTVLHYDLRADDEIPWGLGVGCNGALDILLQPLDPIQKFEQVQRACSIFRKRLDYSTPFSVLTILSSTDETLTGEMFIWEEDHAFLRARWGDLCNRIHRQVLKLKQSGGCSIIELNISRDLQEHARVNILIETFTPIPRLLLFGAGPDAIPVVQVSKRLHWHVTVVDHRPEYAHQSHFPEADQIVLATPNRFPEQLHVDQMTYTVLMSHHFHQDATYLEHVIKQPVPYLGILGPRQRTMRLLNEVSSRGCSITAEALERIHSPIGLDIGAESAEEIALSIVAEMVSRYHQKNGLSLRVKKGPIRLSEAIPGSLLAPQVI